MLCYHAVSETWPKLVAVRPGDLAAQLSFFVRRGYRGMTLSEALTAPTHPRPLVVTFDDAFRSVFTLASPVLKRLGLPGTIFVPTAYPDSGVPLGWDGYDNWIGTAHESELACMSWDDLRTLRRSGWEIGSHSDSHPRLTTLDDVSLERELQISRHKCERELQEPCYSLAYPYGDYDFRVVQATREAGYLLATTVAHRPALPLPLQWPRVIVNRTDTVRRVRWRIWRLATPSVDAAWWGIAPVARRVAVPALRLGHRNRIWSARNRG